MIKISFLCRGPDSLNWDVFVDLSDLSWSIIYHLLKSGPTCPPLLCILSRLTSHDWCRQKPPPLANLVLTLDCRPHRANYQGGSRAGKLHHKRLIYWSRSSILENYYIVLDSSHFPTQYKWRWLCWLASWLVSQLTF